MWQTYESIYTSSEFDDISQQHQSQHLLPPFLHGNDITNSASKHKRSTSFSNDVFNTNGGEMSAYRTSNGGRDMMRHSHYEVSDEIDKQLEAKVRLKYC